VKISIGTEKFMKKNINIIPTYFKIRCFYEFSEKFVLYE